VSDIGIGTTRLGEANVIRSAYDRGVNYIDTAEGYGNGNSERMIGEVMPHMERSKIFITTKLVLREEDNEETIRNRFGECLARMKTDYADALFNHDVTSIAKVGHEGFHAATKTLKAEGKLRHAGISSHGPGGDEGDSIDDVLVAAAEDGRHDLMLFSINFLNPEQSDRIVAACKEKNIGTTAMKIVPGYLEITPFDKDDPHEDWLPYLTRMEERGVPIETVHQNIENWLSRQYESQKTILPFAEKYGIKDDNRLQAACMQWVLENPDMHTVLISMTDFEHVDRIIPYSGVKLSAANRVFLKDYEYAYGSSYCRHSCNDCVSSCPKALPVAKIMRYSYYFAMQRREKYAMGKYARLGKNNASACLACSAPCGDACPHGIAIQANLFKAHSLLSMA
jgi:predicted aldo/keto reductase-like oxidoreductase